MTEKKHCCLSMDREIKDQMSPMEYSGKVREYFMEPKEEAPIRRFYYCPWCGEKLPTSLRDEWFDEMEALGFEDILFMSDEEQKKIPQELLTEEWWQGKY